MATKQWVKGQSGNPKGRPKLPMEHHLARHLNKVEFERIVNEFLNLNAEEMQAKLAQPDTKALELMVGTIMVKAIREGDHARLEFILDRLLGKVPNKLESKNQHEVSIEVEHFEKMNDQELLEYVASNVPQLTGK